MMAFVQEVLIITLIKKDPLPVVAPVINMIDTWFLKFHCLGFGKIEDEQEKRNGKINRRGCFFFRENWEDSSA